MKVNTVKLGDVAKIATGQSAPKSNYFTEEGIPFIRAGSLEFLERDNNIELCEKINKINAKKCKLKLYPNNSILFAKSGMSAKKGRIYKLTQNAYVVSHLAIIIPNETKIIPEYLLYYLKNYSPKTLIKDESYPSINLVDIANINILLPLIEEQKKIANILDKVTSLISLRKEQLKKLDELIKSRFIEMFGDIQHNKLFCNTNLDNICHINPPKKKYNDIEVSFIPMSAVSEKGQINTSNIKQYQEVKTGYTHFLENDVLFAKITPCMENGKGAIAKKLKNGIGFGSTEFHILRPIKDVTISEWIYHLTCLEEFRLEATLNMTGSAGQKRVPEFFLKNFKVILPPLELQNKFASFVEEVEKNKEKVNNSLNKLETLKNALMQKYFG